jgi:hypothetical protein
MTIIILIQGYNINPREYLIAEADYDSTLGLLVDDM